MKGKTGISTLNTETQIMVSNG